MISYLLRRLAGTIPVLVLISLLVFLLIHAAPGDPTL
ncbi:MAG TPA: ABC transporter permease, partial [Candidatus Binatia bacterium]|nr:ABC transporter permease [Candidatus Binatia bacterium]